MTNEFIGSAVFLAAEAKGDKGCRSNKLEVTRMGGKQVSTGTEGDIG